MKIPIIVGQIFGKLTVLEVRHNGKIHEALCRCDCDGHNAHIWAYPLSKLRRGQRLMCRSCAIKLSWTKVKRNDRGEIRLRQREANYRTDAARKGRTWHLDRARFRKIILAPCSYCGLQPANGIDRVNNALGYTKENSAPCCTQCNFAKRNQSQQEFSLWISRIVEYWSGL